MELHWTSLRFVGILLFFVFFFLLGVTRQCQQPGLFPLEHPTVITILIFPIRACGFPLYQKEFPVNEVLITQSLISGGGEDSSLSLVQPQRSDKTIQKTNAPFCNPHFIFTALLNSPGRLSAELVIGFKSLAAGVFFHVGFDVIPLSDCDARALAPSAS